MRLDIQKVAAIGIFILIYLGGPVPISAIDLKTAAQESAPKYFIIGNNKMAGVCVEIMQAIEDIEPQINFTGYHEFLPFIRLQSYLEKGLLDVFFGFKKTAKRKEKYSFVEVPLYPLNYVIAVRIDDTVESASFDDLRKLDGNGKLLTVRGTAASKFLQEEGFLFEDGARSPAMLLKMLIAKRGRFAFYHDLGLRHVIKLNNLDKDVRILPNTYFKYYHFAAFSNDTPLETIEVVRGALQHLSNTGKLDEIYDKYLSF